MMSGVPYQPVPLERSRATSTAVRTDVHHGWRNVAEEHGDGFVLDTPTWRANPDWAARLGYSPPALAELNRRGVELLESMRADAAVSAICAAWPR
jgi:S-methylmethionine-dependent homocysteine/selenocysteine methylase